MSWKEWSFKALFAVTNNIFLFQKIRIGVLSEAKKVQKWDSKWNVLFEWPLIWNAVLILDFAHVSFRNNSTDPFVFIRLILNVTMQNSLGENLLLIKSLD